MTVATTRNRVKQKSELLSDQHERETDIGKTPGQRPCSPKSPNTRLVKSAMRTIQTNSRKLVGTTIYRARTQRMIPLDDPTAWGNGGLEGFDEDCELREFKSKAAAVRWLRARIADDEHAFSGEVAKVEWEPDEFDDDRHDEHVLDAIETTTYVWNYSQRQDGTVTLDDEWKPAPW